MERRKCSRCGHPMTRMLTNDAGRWSACYTCLSCGYEAAAVTAKSEIAAKDGLERFMDRVDLAHEAAAGRSATPTKPRPAVFFALMNSRPHAGTLPLTAPPAPPIRPAWALAAGSGC